MNYSVYVPGWLERLVGVREREILCAADCKPMQCLPEAFQAEEERLPPGQQYLVSQSLNAYFVIDAKLQRIIG